MGRNWFVRKGEKTYGPFSSAKLKALADASKIDQSTKVALDVSGPWHSADRVRGLFGEVPQEAPPLPQPSAQESTPATASQQVIDASEAKPAKPKKATKVKKAKKPPKQKLHDEVFDITISGTDTEGNPRVCEVRFRKRRMLIQVEQPDGRLFVQNAPEPYTAEVRRKTDAGKSSWVYVVSAAAGEEFARDAAERAADSIKWGPPSARKPPKNTMPGYVEPPCTGCGKGIGKQATCFRFPGDPAVQLYCLRCMGKIWADGTRIENIPTPRHMMKAHLPNHTTPPIPYSGGGACSKCSQHMPRGGYSVRWMPTNTMIELCPSCWSKATLHDGWRAQLDLD